MPVVTSVAPAAVFITSSKGGPGKSTFACALVDYYRTRGVRTSAFDADANNETLLQFYGSRDLDGRLLPSEQQEAQRGVHLFNVRNANQRDVMLEVIDHEAGRIVIDLPGGGAEDVADVLDSTDQFFGAFLDGGVQPIVVIVISNSKSSAAAVASTIELFGNKPKYIVARNLHFGDEFPAFDGIEVDGKMRFKGARNALASVGGSVIDFPKLQEETWARWDIASCKLSEAVLEDNPNFTKGDKLRLKGWRERFAAAIVNTPLAL